MSITLKNKHIIIGIAVVLVVTFFSGYIVGRKHENKQQEVYINTLSGQVKKYMYEVGDLQKQATEKDVTIMTLKQALDKEVYTKEELKKLNIKNLKEITHLKTQVEIILDSISNNGQVVIVKPCDSIPAPELPALYLPFMFHKQDKYLDLKGEISETGIVSLNAILPLSIDLWVGYDKSTKMLKGVATTDNPYTVIQDITTIKTDISRQRQFNIGLIGGYGISWGTPGLHPIVGVGVCWNLKSLFSD